MRAGKSDSIDARDLVNRFEEPGEIARTVIRSLIVIDNLPKQLHLTVPGLRRRPDLGEDLRLRSHPLLATSVRNHAEAAVLIAALNDRHPRPHWVAATRHGERKRDIVFGAEVDLYLAGLCCLLQQHRQHPNAPRPDDDVDRA